MHTSRRWTVGQALAFAAILWLILGIRAHPVSASSADAPFGFVASIDTVAGRLGPLSPVSSGAALDVAPGLLFELGTVRVTRDGMRVEGSGRAELRYRGEHDASLTAHFAGVLVRETPYRLVQGTITIQDDAGTPLALVRSGQFTWVGPGGDPLPGDDPIVSNLPDVLPLPVPSLAGLEVRSGGSLRVDVAEADNGTLLLAPQATPPRLLLPLFGPSAHRPAAFEQLVVSAETHEILSGTVSASVPVDDPSFRMRDFAFAPSAVAFSPSNGLLLEGRYTLFGEPVPLEAVQLPVPSGGVIEASGVDRSLDGIEIRLVEDSDRAVVRLARLTGSTTYDASAGSGTTDFEIEATLELRGSTEPAVRADVTLQAGPAHATLADWSVPQGFEGAPIDLGSFRLDVGEVRDLTLGHSDVLGFQLAADLELDLAGMGTDAAWRAPLDGVVLTEDGFAIPPQTFSAGDPGAEPTEPFAVGPVALELLEMRIAAPVQFDWFQWSAPEPTGIDPRFDFAVTLPGFADDAPALAEASMTLQDAALDGTALVGAIVPYAFHGEGVRVPMGSVELWISEVRGALGLRDDGAQAVDVAFTGRLAGPDVFEPRDDPAPCTDSLSVQLAGASGFAGVVDAYVPCGVVSHHPLAMQFEPSTLTFEVVEGEQRVVLDGPAEVDVHGVGLSGGSATGALRMDLSARRLLDADVAFESLSWTYPAEAPLFHFDLPTAGVTDTSLVASGSGALTFAGADDATASAAFDDVHVAFADGRFASGGVTFDDPFAVVLGLSPLTWGLAPELSTDGSGPAAQFIVEAGTVLAPDGLSLSGDGSGHLRIPGDSFDAAVAMTFDAARIGAGPAAVRDGQIRFLADDAGADTLATLDADGFRLGDRFGALDVPDRLPLPTEATAYVVLRDSSSGDLLVEQGEEDPDTGRRRVYTAPGRSVAMVLASLGEADGEAPTLHTALDVFVDESYQVVAGSLYVDRYDDPLSLESQAVPLDVLSLTYADPDGDGYRLTAATRLALNGVLEEKLEVVLPEALSLGEQGFADDRRTFGEYRDTHDPETAHVTLADAQLNDGLDLIVRGLDLRFQSGTFRMAGSVASDLFGRVGDGTQSVPGAANGPAVLHVTGAYQGGRWTFAADDSHVADALPVGDTGILDPDDERDVAVTANADVFALDIGGVMSLPAVSDAFRVTLDALHLGTDSLGASADFESAPQRLDLFGDVLALTVTGGSLSVEDDNLFLRLDGDARPSFSGVADDGSPPAPPDGDDLAQSCDLTDPQTSATTAFQVAEMTAGTDGSFDVGDGNLLAGYDPVQILPGRLCVNRLLVTGSGNERRLQLGLLAETPDLRTPQATRSPSHTVAGDVVVAANGAYSGAFYATYDAVTDAPQDGGIVGPLRPRQGEDPQYGAAMNGSFTEMEIAERAVFEVTGLSVDVDLADPLQSAVAAAAALHVVVDTDQQGNEDRDRRRGRRPGDSEEGEDSEGGAVVYEGEGPYAAWSYKSIPFGDPFAMDDDEGIHFQYARGDDGQPQGTVDWYLDQQRTSDFEVPISPLAYAFRDLVFDPATLSFEMNGAARLALPNVEGSVGFEGTTLNFADASFHPGVPTGAGAFSIEDVINLEVGCMDFGTRRPGDPFLSFDRIVATTGPDGATRDSIVTVDSLNSYVTFGSFGDCEAAGEALAVSLGSEEDPAFAGSMRGLVYYERGRDVQTLESRATSLAVEDVDLELKRNMAHLKASLEYESDPTGWRLGVTGVGRLRAGGTATHPLYKSLVASGTISTHRNDLAFGIFVAAHADAGLFPVVPGVVELTGVGGGFFYRPRQEDLQAVVDALDAMVETSQITTTDVELPSGANFGLQLYAGVGIGGSQGNYSFSGDGLLTITDQFFAADVNGEVMPAASSIQELTAAGYLIVSYGDDPGLAGGMAMNVKYGPNVRTGGRGMLLRSQEESALTVDFFVNPSAWAVEGSGSLMAMGDVLQLEGGILACPDGFLAQVGATASAGSGIAGVEGIIEVEGQVGLDFWWNTAQAQVGAYAELGAEARVLGGLAEVGALMKGALIVGADRSFLYAGANAYVSVAYVFEGNVDLWMALDNGTARGGIGRNEAYEVIVAESRALADAMEEATQRMAEQAQGVDVSRYTISPDEVAQAGLNAIEADSEGRALIAETMLGEQSLWTGHYSRAGEWGTEEENVGFPSVLHQVTETVVEGNERPHVNPDSVETLRLTMNASLNDVDEQAGAVDELLQAIDLTLSDEEFAFAGYRPVASPLASRTSGAFAIDTLADQSQRADLSAFRAEQDTLAVAYAAQVDDVEASLATIDSAFVGLTDYARAFVDATENIGGYYGALRRFLGGEYTWATTTHAWLQESESAIDAAFYRFNNRHDQRGTSAGTFRYTRYGRCPGETRVDTSYYAPVVARAPNVLDVQMGDHVPYDDDAPGHYNVRREGGTAMAFATAYRRWVLQTLADQDWASFRSMEAGGHESYGEVLTTLLVLRDSILAETNAVEGDGGQVRPDRPDLRDAAYCAGRRLYYDTMDQGLSQRAENLRDSLFVLDGTRRAQLASIQSEYDVLTDSIDVLYARRAQFTEKAAALYREYARWLRDRGATEQAESAAERQQELMALLEPPTVASFAVTPTAETDVHVNRLAFAWDASHAGDVEESALRLVDARADGSGTPIRAGGTVGDATSLVYTAMPDGEGDGYTSGNGGQSQRSIAATLVVRSPAGATFTTQHTVTAALGEENAPPPGDAPSDPVDLRPPGATDPPAISWLEIVGSLRVTADCNAEALSCGVYWFAPDSTGHVHEISARLAADNPTDDDLSWSARVYDAAEQPASEWQLLGTASDTAAVSVLLPTDVDGEAGFYVGFRARTGFNATDSLRVGPMFVESEPPDLPPADAFTTLPVRDATVDFSVGLSFSHLDPGAAEDTTTHFIHDPGEGWATNCCDGEIPFAGPELADVGPSGLYAVDAVASTHADSRQAFAEGTSVRLFTASSDVQSPTMPPGEGAVGFTPAGERYVHLRAVDRAGNAAYRRLPDPEVTRPAPPVVSVDQRGAAGPILWIDERAVDPESGVTAYEVLRSCIEGATYDTGLDGYDPEWVAYPEYPRFYADLHWDAELGTGTRYSVAEADLVDSGSGRIGFVLPPSEGPAGRSWRKVCFPIVRAVNGHGIRSYHQLLGQTPLRNEDVTPPVVTWNVTGVDDGALQVTATDLHDPESGIREILHRTIHPGAEPVPATETIDLSESVAQHTAPGASVAVSVPVDPDFTAIELVTVNRAHEPGDAYSDTTSVFHALPRDTVIAHLERRGYGPSMHVDLLATSGEGDRVEVVTLQVQDPHDPAAGLDRLEYRFTAECAQCGANTWTTVPGFQASTPHVAPGPSYDLTLSADGNEIEALRVRAVSGFGVPNERVWTQADLRAADLTPPMLAVSSRGFTDFPYEVDLSLDYDEPGSAMNALDVRVSDADGAGAWRPVPGFDAGAAPPSDTLEFSLSHDAAITTVAVRAVNAAGKTTTRTLDADALLQDDTPPTLDAVTDLAASPDADEGPGFQHLTFTVRGASDAQSGVERVEYRVLRDNRIRMWAPIPGFWTHPDGPFAVTLPDDDPANAGPRANDRGFYRLEVKVTNGAGLETVRSIDLDPYDTTPPPLTVEAPETIEPAFPGGTWSTAIAIPPPCDDPESGETTIEYRARTDDGWGAWRPATCYETMNMGTPRRTFSTTIRTSGPVREIVARSENAAGRTTEVAVEPTVEGSDPAADPPAGDDE